MISSANMNVVRSDYPILQSQRDAHARYTGHLLYSGRSASGSSSLTSSGTIPSVSIPEDRRACCGIMTPVRRTFCLMLLFDLILTFLLWVIYTQISGKPGKKLQEALLDQIIHYTFVTSLFDTVMCAMWRFVPLLLAYALFRLNHPWPIAVTTSGTCVFLLCKVFIYDFDNDKNNFMCYTLLIISFTIAWAETWFLDFKVLPQENKAREREALLRSIGSIHESRGIRDEILGGYGEQYYSPTESQDGSDDDLLRDHRCSDDDDFRSLPGTTGHSRATSVQSFNTTLGDEEADYRDIAETCWDEAWAMAHDDEAWKLECGKDDITGCVYSKSYPRIGKLYRAQCIVECNPKVLFQELVFRVQESPAWNTTVLECRVLHIIDNNTDILYSVAAESAGGVVSSRDFINLRRWGLREGVYISCGRGVTHPHMPPSENHVRGINGPSIWLFRPVPDSPNKCLYTSIINTDLKGWIPQLVIDQALSGVLLTGLRAIRTHMDSILNHA